MVREGLDLSGIRTCGVVSITTVSFHEWSKSCEWFGEHLRGDYVCRVGKQVVPGCLWV